MSGGYNHYSGCPCPWCYHPSYLESDEAQPIRFQSATRDSYTVPNARCPECGNLVFFYRSPHGGSVYFDELGVPWPKHPCMDSGDPPRRYQRGPATDPEAHPIPKWQRDGWIPIGIYVLGKPDKDGIQTLFAIEVGTNISHNWETSNMPETAKDEPALARKNTEGKWDVETPSGKYVATDYRIKFDPSKWPLWRQRWRASGKRGTASG